jgi:hypothetical protein
MRLATALHARVPPLTACLLAGLLLIGCTSSADVAAGPTPTADASSPSGPPATSAPTGATGSPAPASPSDAATTPTRDPGAGVLPGGGGTGGTGEIGPTPIRYPSGLTVGVTSAIQYTPSAQAVGTVVGHTGVVLTVEVTNGSTQPLNTAYLTVALRTGTAFTLAAQIFDAANGYGSGLTGTIAPGKTASAQYAFDLPASDLSSLNVLVTPDLRSPRSASFTGSATAAGAASASPQPSAPTSQ